jgi:pre-mRNA-splicing factor ISY1
LFLEYEEAVNALKAAVNVEDDSLLPKLREKDFESIPSIVSAKRKGVDGDGDQAMEDTTNADANTNTKASTKASTKGKAKGKKGKKTEEAALPPPPPPPAAAPANGAPAANAAKGQLDVSAMIPFLTAEHLAQPKMPTKEEMDAILLDLRKRALLQEYVGVA